MPKMPQSGSDSDVILRPKCPSSYSEEMVIITWQSHGQKYVQHFCPTSFANASDHGKSAENYIKSIVPAKYHRAMIPTYRT